MRKYFLFLLFFLFLLENSFAKVTNEEIIKNMETRAALLNQRGVALKEKDLKAKKASLYKYNKDTYKDVAIYFLITKRNTDLDNLKFKNNYAKEVAFMSNNKNIFLEKMKKLKEEDSKSKEIEEKNKEKVYNLTGYCRLRNAIEVERTQAYSMLDCEFRQNDLHLENTEMFVEFVPVYDRLALIGRPIYLNVNHNKIPIKNGVLLTVDQSSLNLATFINDVKIKNLLADMALATNDVVYNSSMAYLNDLRASRTKENLAIVTNNNGQPVVTKSVNSQKPKSSDYVIAGGIQLLSSMINALGNFYKENNYPLFRIKEKTQFYVDFVIETDGIKQHLINYRLNDYATIKKPKQRKYTNMKFQNFEK